MKFLPILLLFCFHGAWAQLVHPTVKVISSFNDAGQDQIEGSGLFVYDSNLGAVVLTSSHVVIPDAKGKATHRIQIDDGSVLPAQLLSVHWSLGLAILKVNYEGGSWRMEKWSDMSQTAYGTVWDYKNHILEPRSGRTLHAYGYPIGNTAKRDIVAVSELSSVPKGEVITGSAVFGAKNLNPEPGLSGGPVFDGQGSLVGIMSHALNSENPITYIIPVRMILSELPRTVDDMVTTAEDLRLQYFSPDHPEVVRHRYTGVTIEKKKGQFVVSSGRQGIDAYGFSNEKTALAQMLIDMGHNGNHVMRLTSVGGRELTATTPLARAIFLLNRPTSYQAVDFEMEKSGELEKFPQIPYFVPCSDQSLAYDFFRDGKKVGTGYQSVPYYERGHSRHSYESRSVIQTGNPISPWDRTEGLRDLTDFWSTDAWRDLQSRCQKQGGQLEVVRVPAGAWPSCHTQSLGLHVWRGPVPITGIIKTWDESRGGLTQVLTQVQYAGSRCGDRRW